MKAADLKRYKQLLITKRDDVLATRNDADSLAPAAGHMDGDLADQAVAETEAKLEVRMRQTESHLLRAIDEALARIAHGSFGICKSCGNPVGDTRLKAVPWTRQCLECKEKKQA